MALCALTFAGVALLLGLALMTPQIRKYAKSRIEDEVSGRLTGRLSIGSIQTNLVGGIDFYDIVLNDPVYGDSAYIRHCGIDYSPLRLISKKISIEKITVENAFVSGVRSRRAGVRWPFLPKRTSSRPSKSKSSWSLAIDSVHVKNLNARYHDSLFPMTAALDTIEADARFFRLDSVFIRVKSNSGSVVSPWWTGGIAMVEAAGAVSGARLFLDTARIEADSSRLAAGGAISFKKTLPWDLHVEASSNLAPITVLKKVTFIGAAGSLRARARWRGPLTRPLLTLRAAAREVSARNVPLDTLTLVAEYDGERLLTSTAFAASAYGSADARAVIAARRLFERPAFGAYTVLFAGRGFRPAEVSRRLGAKVTLPNVVARFSGSAAGDRFTEPPDSLGVSLCAGDARLRRRGDSVRADLLLQNRRWKAAASAGPDNRIEGAGTLEPGGALSGTFTFAINNPGALSRYAIERPVTGSIGGNGAIRGAIARPVIEISIRADTLAWSGIAVERANVRARFARGRFSIDTADVQTKGTLDSMAPLFGIRGMAGRFSATARGGGPRFFARIDIADVKAGTFSADSLGADVAYEGDTVTWNSLRIVKTGAAILSAGSASFAGSKRFAGARLRFERPGTGHGEVSIEGSLTEDSIAGRVSAAGFDLGLLLPWIQAAIPLRGVFTLDAGIGGSQSNPSARAAIEVTHRLGAGQTISWRGGATVRDRLLEASVRAARGDTAVPLAVSFRAPLAFGPPWTIDGCILDGARLTVDGANVRLGDIVESFFSSSGARGAASADLFAIKEKKTWRIGGTAVFDTIAYSDTARRFRAKGVNARATLGGTIARPLIFTNLSGDSVSWAGRDFRKARVRLRIANDTAYFDTLRASLEGGYAGLEGAIPLQALYKKTDCSGVRLRFAMTDVPLWSLGSFPPPLAFTAGAVSGQGEVVMRAQRPSITGHITLARGVFTIADCEPPAGPIDMQLSFFNDSVSIESISGSIGESGRLEGKGSLGFGARARARFAVTARDIRIQCSDFDFGIQKAAVRLDDSAGVYILDGGFDLAETRYSTFISPVNIYNKVRRARSRPSGKPNPLLDRVVLRVAVNLGRNVTMETNIGRFVLDGTLSITGSPARPGIAGAIEIVEGYVYYFDRKFTIESGSFRLPDPYDPNPLIDLTATAQVTSIIISARGETIEAPYTVTLAVGGDLRNPAVALTSDPPLGQERIVSLLTLGTTQGTPGVDLARRFEGLLARQFAGFGTRRLEEWLNIESIDIDMLGRRGTTLTTIKRLTSRLIISYQTILGRLGEPKVTATYRLRPSLYLMGSGDYTAGAGFDLHVRYIR